MGGGGTPNRTVRPNEPKPHVHPKKPNQLHALVVATILTGHLIRILRGLYMHAWVGWWWDAEVGAYAGAWMHG